MNLSFGHDFCIITTFVYSFYARHAHYDQSLLQIIFLLEKIIPRLCIYLLSDLQLIKTSNLKIPDCQIE